MELVPGICTQCGATLSADNSKDCMICPYCGTPFIVEKAINHFQNTYNISNSVVHIYGGESRDFSVRAGVLERYNGSGVVVTIPDDVTVIGKSAFSECFGLEEVIIPEGVVSIEDSAFCGCRLLNKINLPQSLRKIGMDAFGDCISIEQIILPDNLTELQKWAFRDCENLQEIRMPNNTCNSVVYRHTVIFLRCHKLTKVDLPDKSWRAAMHGSMYYAKYQERIEHKELIEHRKQQKLCVHCGGAFKGIRTKCCSNCGKPKDY